MANEKDKKSQASIMSMILIIMIVLVAIMIFWNIFNPLIRGKTEEIAVDSFTTNLKIKEALSFVNGASKITLSRGSGEGEISSLKFVFYDDEEKTHVETKESDLVGQLETKTYSFDTGTLGKIKKVSVFPVFNKKLGMETETEVGEVLEIPKSLVSWWRFDGNSKDFVGDNDCGEANVAENPERGQVASFNNMAVDCGNNADLNVNDKAAIGFWVKTNSDGSIIRKGDNYEISLVDGRVVFSYGESLVEGVSEVDDGKWHHVVFSGNWAGMGSATIYIDGELDPIVPMQKLPKTNEDSVLIGNFNGFIDEIMFFNEPLSQSQAESIYNNLK